MAQLIKRTYHVDIRSDVLEIIQEVAQPFLSPRSAFWHDLYGYLLGHGDDNNHPDLRFFLADPSINEYIQADKDNTNSYKRYVKRELTKAYKQRNLKRSELKRELDFTTKQWQLFLDTANQAKLTKKKRWELKCQPGGAEDMRKKKNQINNLIDEIERPVYEHAEKHYPDPCPIDYLQSLFSRSYWIHTYVSYLPPIYLKDRTYSIVSEEPVQQSEQQVQKLPTEYHDPVQWKSRNRGGKVTLSGKGFDKVASKHYPPNLPNQA